MSIASIITQGYGTWGGVELLPTLGYGIASGGAEPVYTRIGVLFGAAKTNGSLFGATSEPGTLNGTPATIGVLSGDDSL